MDKNGLFKKLEVLSKETDCESAMVNIDFNIPGELKKRKGYKTFKGMVYQLNLINKRYKKLGIVGDFTIRLPLK